MERTLQKLGLARQKGARRLSLPPLAIEKVPRARKDGAVLTYQFAGPPVRCCRPQLAPANVNSKPQKIAFSTELSPAAAHYRILTINRKRMSNRRPSARGRRGLGG